MSDQSTLRRAGDFVVRLFAPLREATEDIDSFRAFFLRLGFAIGEDDIPAGYLTLADDILGAITLVQSLSDDASLSDVDPVFKAVSALYKDLRALPPPSGVDISAEDLAKAMVDVLVTDFLIRELPQVWSVLQHLGLTESVYIPPASGSQRRAILSQKVLWGDFPKVLGDPASIPNRVYGWGDETFDFSGLAADLLHALTTFGVHARVRTLGTAGMLSMQSFVEDPDQMRYGRNVALDVIVMDDEVADEEVEVGLSVLALPGEGTHKPGLVLQPLVPENFADTIELTDNLSLVLKGSASLSTAFGVVVRPKEDPFVKQPFTSGATPLTGDASVALETTFDAPVVLLGSPSGSRLDVAGLRAAVEFLASTGGKFEARLDVGVKDVRIVLDGGDGDGFIGKILGSGQNQATFSFNLRWSSLTGVSFGGAGGFKLTRSINKTLGPIHFGDLELAIAGRQRESGAGVLAVEAGVGVDATLGPVSAVLNGLGVHLDVAFESGNAGPVDIGAGLKPPTGVGIAVNGGPVSGGGFLTFDDSKYSGALALSVYAVAVKAFGIIETKFPDGHRGFSFIIIISAEFTPIQLGFGFTLNGVGGILGINRDLNEDALRDVVQRGSMGNVLFPKDPIKDAPSILHDIAQLFPAADGHFVFGPMAILAWGTPAIVEARLGIIIVFPGPRIALLGTVQVLLPPGTGQQAPEKRLVEIHLDIAGVLDFPKKHFALDAHLHDSNVVGFPISGDMAARIDWGANPNMVIAMGGFHPHFTPPAGFPKLRRLSIDLGIKGNPTATLSGYMAVTSNTAQIGAALDVTASAAGASLKGGLAFDAIFVFSPFSFDATLEGGVHVDFHGAGFGMHFHGEISGPAPWHLKGDVCVSILWWDACVGFNLTLGGEKKPELPAVDVWAGSAEVPGLQSAIAAPGNWTALMPPNGYQAVSLRETDASSASRVDPLGTAKFEQKVLPFTLAISKFAGRDRAKNDAVKVTLNKVVIDGDDLVAGGRVNPESDFFAPAQYQKLPDAQALSSPSFQPMQAGFSFTSKDLKAGVEKTKVISFQTFVVGNPGTGQVSDFPVNDNQLLAMTGRSAVATGGLRTGNIDRFVDFGKQPAFTFTMEAYALAFKSTLKRFTTATDDAAYALTADKLAAQPADVRGTLQIVPVHELAA